MEKNNLTYAEQIETPKFQELKKEFHEKYPDLKSFNLAEYLKDFDMEAEMSLPLLEYIFSLDINFNATTKKGASALMFSIKAQAPIEVIKILIENGADVNACAESGASTLMSAVIFKSPAEIVKLLIDNGADVNTKTKKGDSALMSAIRFHAPIEIIKLLVENGADVNTVSKLGSTPLMLAIGYQSQTEIIKLLIENGADVNAYSKDNASVLIGAVIFHAPIEIIKLLVENGADINADTEKNFPVLAFAIQHQTSIEIIKLLIEDGADVNVVFNNGMALLMFAIIFEQREEVIELLVNNGADVNAVFTENSMSVLTFAIMLEAPEKFVKLLIDSGADVNAGFSNGMTLLMFAIIFEQREEVIELLVNNGADVNAVLMENSISVLMFAAMIATTEEIVEFLINSGADVNYDGAGASSLTIAMLCQSSQEMIELLEKYDTHTPSEKKHMLEEVLFEIFEEDYLDDMNVKYRDFTKNIIATRNEMKTKFSKTDIIDIKSIYKIFEDFINNMNWKLQELFNSFQINMPTPIDALQRSLPYEIDINRTMNGKTLLSIAIKKQDKELIKLLIDNDADVNVTLDNGKTALEFAEFIGDKQLLEMIKNSSTFKKSNHNPKRLVEILKNFRGVNPIRYTTHEWDKTLKDNYTNYEDFLKMIRSEWDKVSNELEQLSPTLYKKIYSFLLSKQASENWCSLDGDDIAIGWSSLTRLQEWCDDGNNPFNYTIPQKYKIMDRTITTFSEIIELFKHEIQIRNQHQVLDKEDMLEELFMDIEEKIFDEDWDIEYKNLEQKEFYTDIEKFRNGIKTIFQEIEKQQKQSKKIKIEVLEKEDKPYYDIKIIHIDSMSGHSSKDMQNKGEGGNTISIKESLKNLCDWSIESSHKNENYRINFLYSQSVEKIELLEYKPEGFTHVLRFYK